MHPIFRKVAESLTPYLVTAVSAAGVIFAASCKVNESQLTVGQPLTTLTKLDALPYSAVRLVLAGEVVPATLKRVEKEGLTEFQIVRDGAILEREVYSFSGSTFQLNEIAGVTYEPPVPLVFDPVAIGDDWVWKGTVKSGSQALPATGKLTASREDLNVAGGPFSSVRISFNLSMKVQPDTVADRSLIFWFVDDRGLIKREVGAASAREPQ